MKKYYAQLVRPVQVCPSLSDYAGGGAFCVLGRPILQSSYRFPQYCNVSKASYSASGLFLFSGSIGSISIAEVYLLAHLVVIATLIHVAMLFPDAIHHRLHSRMFFNVQLLFGDGYFLRELVFWMPAVVASSVYHHSGRVEYVPISFYESQCFIESSAVSFLIRNYIKLMRHLRHLSVRSASSLMRSSSFPLRPTVPSTRHDGSVRPSDGWNGPRFPRPVRHPRPLT